ncbi:hypothetical protein I8G32_02598 [Rhodopseudomonas palustris]|uniref:Uncharacterized protein n=1 Tax=Rhodopseudomonas palustris (strain ATCC BAA-98 / CGA009) TaxID=258594 RepID=Q6N6T4_RHOPA|nr:hypothetical protein [Rhodopseudomonas palustris]OPF90229.1 hypothetical protein B1S06_22805 [Rhodopseudomonas palustris]QQM04049.1 hypothetical protein I8G32_02598 [Rhodopseudomonas palustris]RJF62108.1 hypothetical protein D4Q71_20545 [Rhodopseudomonas palustris]WAB75443.1 hypothetical protein OR798_13075 [Rhodopseudomonas palustris]WCL92687.1 hypothetical protein TX73_013070 [Rhodopseudomonas palustris CGA009]
MSEEPRISVNLPFPGFYDSLYSSEIDDIEQREAEYFAEHRQDEDGVPPELRIDQDKVAEILLDVTDYSAAYLTLAKTYSAAFDHVVSAELDLKLSLVWEEMTSPRAYNFETDRIFCSMPLSVAEELLRRSEAAGHEILAEVIRKRFTSRSGFSSFYSNDINDWLEKPLEIWDHNEVGTLLAAMMDDPNDRDLTIYYATVEGGGAYDAWSNAVDWKAFDRKVEEAREELAETLRADDPSYAPRARCDRTIDMFTGREG